MRTSRPVHRRTSRGLVRNSGKKDIEELVRRAQGQGWLVEKTKKGYWRFLSADKSQPPIVTPSAPSDWRSLHNTKASLRRAGLDLGDERKTKKNGRRTSRGRASDADVARDFHRLVNMSAAEIRRWARDPRSLDASFDSTLRELPLLAKMKETPVESWTDAMWNKARRAVSFIKRHEAQMAAQGRKYGTALHATHKRIVALRNWGRKTPRVTFR